MLKKALHLIMLMAAVLLCGCGNDVDSGIMDSGAGFIAPHVTVAGEGAPDVSAFSLTLTDGASMQHTWSSVDDFSARQGFRPGRYVMTASYGALNSEGYGMPFYSGSAAFSVVADATTDVNISCSRINVAVRLDVDASFASRISEYTVIFHSKGGGYFAYNPEAEETLYLRQGDTEMFMQFRLTDGREASVMMYKVPTRPGDDLDFTLSADDTSITLDVAGHDPHVLPLTPELFSSAAPVIDTRGFASDSPLAVVEGVSPSSPVVFDVTSSHKLGEVILTVQAPSLLALGIGCEIDLLHADPSVIDLLRRYGAELTVAPDGKSLTLDVSGLLANLKASDMPRGFADFPSLSLVAVNDLGQVSRPVTLNVDLRPMEIVVMPPGKVEVGAATATVRVKATSADFVRHLALYTSTDGGVTWEPRTLTGSSEVSSGVYDVTFSLPESVYPVVKVRMDYLGEQVAMFDLYFTSPSYGIAVDPFASHIVVKIIGASAETVPVIASSAYVYVNGAPANVYKRDTEKGLLYVTGLTPSSYYVVSSTIFRHPESDDFTPQVAIMTEDILQLPNGAFEDTEEVINRQSLPSGGTYSQNSMPLYNRQNRADVTASQPKAPWTSVNDKTFYCNAANPNTWYMQPSTMESTNIISGAISIKLVSVAFDPAGPNIAPYRQVSQPFINYNPNVPDIRYRAAGKIFLGTYAYDGTSENYQEGYPFTSRPSAINGIYRYYPGHDSPEDCGRVDISLWGIVDGRYCELTHSTGKLYPSATNASFSVPVRYPIFGAKATTIKVMISSSYEIGDIDYESHHVVTTPDARSASSTGSVLEVDELTLSY